VTEREPETSLPGLIAHEFDLALLEEYPGHPQRRRPELDYRELASDPMRLAQHAGADADGAALARADAAIHLSDLPGSPARRIYAATRRGASQQPALAAVSQALATAIQASSHHDPDNDMTRLTSNTG